MKWLRGFWKSSDKPPSSEKASAGPFIRKGTGKISVGLDFGTHGTKAVTLQLGAGQRVFRALNFRHGLSGWPDFVLPAVGVIRNHTLSWGVEAATALQRRPWHAGIRRLKVHIAAAGDPAFIDEQLQSDYCRVLEDAGVDPVIWRSEHVAAAALALQMVEVRRHLRAAYPRLSIDAQFTIPVPIDHAQNSRTLSIYRQVGNTAHQLVTEGGELRYARDELVAGAAEYFPRASETEMPEGRVNVLPEAVAQVASYLASLEATIGVYGVVDIGAGTTDVSVFSLRRPSQHVQKCYWYSAIAVPKAVAFVHSRVAAALASESPIDVTEADLIRETNKRDDVVAAALEEIRLLCRVAWQDAYRHYRVDTEWRQCPVFLCGGGSLLRPADKVFRRAWVPNWPAHKIKILPTPRDFDGAGIPFQRLTVAYGLAIPGPEHGHPILPKDSPDHTPPKTYRPIGGADGDQLVPKPGWI